MPTVSSCGFSTTVSRTRCELFKLLRVIGEGETQTVVPVTIELPAGTKRIVSVTINTAQETFHVFTGKVVKQGVLVIEVIFVNSDCELATCTATAPFISTLEIAGVRPGMEVDIQFRNVRIENDLTLVDDTLTGKIVVVEFIKVSEFVQRFLQTCEGSTVFPTCTCPTPTNVMSPRSARCVCRG